MTTCSTRLRHLRDFLIDRFGTRAVNLNTLTPEDIAHFMCRYTAGGAPISIKAAGISLRNYFSLKASRGEPTTALIAALPRIAQWLWPDCRRFCRRRRSNGSCAPSIPGRQRANVIMRSLAAFSIWACAERKSLVYVSPTRGRLADLPIHIQRKMTSQQ